MAKYGVYIIEFLRKEDFRDGKILNEILKLSSIPTQYSWVNNIEDFKRQLKRFGKSEFRYLHISCHADETGFEINNQEISNQQIQKLTKNLLCNKRLFLSACKGGNRNLASRIIIANNAYSLLGIPAALHFDKSVLFWQTFYHLINEIDSNKMKQSIIIDIVKKCVDLLKIPVNYYGRIKNNKTHLQRLKIRHNLKVDNRKIKSSI